MRRILLALAAVTALLVSPALAQTVQERLEKARTEVNATQNAADRALTAIKKPDIPKATLEINAAKNAASRALYAIDQALKAVVPAPPPPPPTPPPATQTCADGTVIPATSACPPPHPPPPAQCPDGSTVPAGQTCPVVPPPPPPTPPGDEISPSLSGVVPIPSNFDVSPYLKASGPTGTMAPDVVGAFRFVCMPGQLLNDDPIVFPGQPGRSHLHQFYGNTGADAKSTYKSLRETGQSTCMNPLNRSAYWMPAMLDGKGNVVRPDYVNIYYKRRPISDAACKQTVSTKNGQCIELPNALKFIFGFDMLTNLAPTGAIQWVCLKGSTPQGVFQNIPASAASCPPIDGTTTVRLGAVIGAPSCWDGKRLDSANHRDHVAYKVHGWGIPGGVCPDKHPYSIPTFTMGAYYTVAAGDNPAMWRLSSDDMRPSLPYGSTFHADFWMAWDPSVKKMWHDGCIDKLLNCSAGNMGNGQALVQSAPFSWFASPRLVPVPGT